MRIVIGCDHAGFPLKKRVIEAVRQEGHRVIDIGTTSTKPVDYPDYARKLAGIIQSEKAERGIILCGSGVGACIVANKFRGIRAGMCHDPFSARQCVEDDDANVLCLGARVIGPGLAVALVRIFLKARFSRAERHRRRVSKIFELENLGGLAL